MKRTLYILLLLLILALVSCSGSPTQFVETTTAAPTATIHLPATRTPLPPATNTPLPTDSATASSAVAFDGERSFEDVEKQVAFGPRLPGSEAHARTVDWIKQELVVNQWIVEMQDTTYQNQPVHNVIAKQGEGKTPWIIIGAHYDSRMKADHDPDPAKQETPVPGANDGASGVAILLELARVLPKDLDKQVWLVFFDSEDQGQLPGWDWILGSRAFAESLTTAPDAVIVVDMVGDAALNIPKERNSNPELVGEIWGVAAQRGHDQFLPNPGYAMLDDHTPFLQRGFPAVDIIDFDYVYWHTVEDTPDKVSSDSLYAVGDTLLHWLVGK